MAQGASNRGTKAGKAKGAKGGQPAKGAAKRSQSAKASQSAKRSQPAAKPATARARAGGGRSERLSEARRRRQRRRLYFRLGSGAVVLLLGGAALYFSASSADEKRSLIAQLTSGPGECDYDTRHDREPVDNTQVHVSNPTYQVEPPAGGAHEPSAAPPGFYSPENVPSDGKLVHAMEHGFVVLWYRPDLGPAERQELEKLSDRFGRELIVAPRQALAGEATVTAWHRRLHCRTIDPAAIALFTTSFKDEGPEKGFL